MLHRMALRVLPSLSLAVTEDSVRKQKRLVMLVPGLVAFGIYRLAKHLVPLTEPIVLLVMSGLVGLLTALLAYRAGRGIAWTEVVREDGRLLLTWMAGWIGFVYAIQLSLLVLALLWLVGYDYLQHPDGPAMMAIIISCTAIARDAFEIGHVRRLTLMGRPCPTFPNGSALRSLLANRGMIVGPWILSGLVVGAAAASLGAFLDNHQTAVLVQVLAVTILAGGLALCAYFGGLKPSGAMRQMRPRSLPLFRSRYCLSCGGIDHGCSIVSRYMSQTKSVPSGVLAKSTGRNQLSLDATNSRVFSSAGRSAMGSMPSAPERILL